jgi:hypothetical protein
MKMHELKTVNPYFTAVWDGKKLFEIRKDDRKFESHDILWLREYFDNNYTGRSVLCHVTYCMSDLFIGLKKGYCAMGIEILQKREWAGEVG